MPFDDVQHWQRQAEHLLTTHYGQQLDDTTLVCDSVVHQHLRDNISPGNAVNALARIYDWPRSDMPTALFTPELNSVADALARFSLNPGSLAVHRVASDIDDSDVVQEVPELGTVLLPPPSAESVDEVAANDEEEGDDPDDPGICLRFPGLLIRAGKIHTGQRLSVSFRKLHRMKTAGRSSAILFTCRQRRYITGAILCRKSKMTTCGE
nr:TA system toxin CbtA family protein [Pectobacterium colocasium]